MDVINLWKTTGDKKKDGINIIKTWLVGGTDGQTYSIADNVLDFDANEIEKMGYMYDFPEEEFDKIVGYVHDYTLDSERLDETAEEIYNDLVALNRDIVENPDKYFNRSFIAEKKFTCNAHEGIECEYLMFGDERRCGYGCDCPFKVEIA